MAQNTFLCNHVNFSLFVVLLDSPACLKFAGQQNFEFKQVKLYSLSYVNPVDPCDSSTFLIITYTKK